MVSAAPCALPERVTRKNFVINSKLFGLGVFSFLIGEKAQSEACKISKIVQTFAIAQKMFSFALWIDMTLFPR